MVSSLGCCIGCSSTNVAWRAVRNAALNGDLDPSEVLLREQRRDVERALRRLSTKLREVVVLRFAADLDYPEISETLRIPVGTVKRRIFVAKAKLREILEDE